MVAGRFLWLCWQQYSGQEGYKDGDTQVYLGAASIRIWIFLKLKSGGAASIAVRPINGILRYFIWKMENEILILKWDSAKYWFWFWYWNGTCQILILIFILNWDSAKYWYWFWNWNGTQPNFDFDFDIEMGLAKYWFWFRYWIGTQPNFDIDFEIEMGLGQILILILILKWDLPNIDFDIESQNPILLMSLRVTLSAC